MAIKRPGEHIPDFKTFRKRNVEQNLGLAPDVKPDVQFEEVSTPVTKPISAPKKPEPTAIIPLKKSKPESKLQITKDSKNVTLRAWIHVPLQGNNETYDQTVEAYGEMKAFNLISKNAMAAYDEALQANRITKALEDYPHTKIGVKISRTISQGSYEKAQKIFDPMGLLPPGTLAATICKNAISYYLKKSTK